MVESITETVTISVRRPTDTPTIFVAGTFSEPQWEPLELNVKTIEVESELDPGLYSTEYLFFRDFKLAPGQYQYRFREGATGSWFHDESVKNGKFEPASAMLYVTISGIAA